MNVIFLASALSDLTQSAHEVTQTFGLNLHHFVSQVISFCIVAFCLHRFAYKPVLEALAERKQRIADSLAGRDQDIGAIRQAGADVAHALH